MRRKEHSSWITSQIQFHICANLFQQCNKVSINTKHLWCMHEFEHCHLLYMLCWGKSLCRLTSKIEFHMYAGLRLFDKA
jgi:hypothetical protein